jgi:serine/threonine-protein kinase
MTIAPRPPLSLDVDLCPAFEATFDVALPPEIFCGGAPPPRQPRGRATRDFERTLREAEPELPGAGDTLDKYQLERPLGMGAFAVVFRARHLLLDSTFALKLLRPSVLRRRPELAALLGEEARLAAQLHHVNVVRVVDVTMTPRSAYIVMEYIAGPDLSVVLRQKGLLPPRMVLRIVRHVAEALRAGLRHQLVHRDIKPSNILLTREGVTKLVDFGLARSHELRRERDAVVGTLGYMSPEHIERPHAVDHRSDIFSLGVTAYRALTGVLPVQASSAAHAIELLRGQPITAPLRLHPRITPQISELIMAMLQLDPERRPQSYDELIAATQSIERMAQLR